MIETKKRNTNKNKNDNRKNIKFNDMFNIYNYFVIFNIIGR